MKKFPVPGELSNSEFFDNDVAGSGGVHYDGGQHNGRNGSPSFIKPVGGQNVADFGGINYDNTQIDFGSVKMSLNDDMKWESKNGVLVNPTGSFKDQDMSHVHDMDLKTDRSGGIGLHEKDMGDCSY